MILACEGRAEDDLLSSAREQKAMQRELIRSCQDEGSRRMGGRAGGIHEMPSLQVLFRLQR
jgi:hypothetical protein